jgi:hypothetical protein
LEYLEVWNERGWMGEAEERVRADREGDGEPLGEFQHSAGETPLDRKKRAPTALLVGEALQDPAEWDPDRVGDADRSDRRLFQVDERNYGIGKIVLMDSELVRVRGYERHDGEASKTSERPGHATGPRSVHEARPDRACADPAGVALNLQLRLAIQLGGSVEG